MMLTIDTRENSKLSELVEKKSKALSIPFERKWIEIGDYAYDDVCFEAKSVVDFIGSVISKRLWTQLDNMDRCYQTNLVIVYGDLDEGILQILENSKTKMTPKARAIMLRNKFLGAIGRIVLDTDMKPFWVQSEEEAATIITSVCKMKPMNRTAIRPQIHKRLSTDDMRLDTLTSIKGLSVKKAKALLKEFGSLMEIGECSEYEIQVIEGIGATLAQRILATLNSEEKVKI
mgnify:CR=1 FL=1